MLRVVCDMSVTGIVTGSKGTLARRGCALKLAIMAQLNLGWLRPDRLSPRGLVCLVRRPLWVSASVLAPSLTADVAKSIGFFAAGAAGVSWTATAAAWMM